MKTNALTITNLPAQAGTNDIRALKPPVEIPNFWIWVWVGIGVLVVAAAIFAIWWSSRKKVAMPPIVPIIPPHEEARKKLQEALAMLDQPKPFCVLVSDTVRVYLEKRFDFRAPDRTTEEFLYELKATDRLLPDQKESLGEFLSVCDMVKFAKYEPGKPELQALHNSASRLIDETEPQPAGNEPVQVNPAS
jgi:hypothetical protein